MSTSVLNRAGAASAAPAAAAPPQRRRRRTGSGWWPLLFVGPFFAGIALFYLFPIVQTTYYSFTTWGPFGGATFTGLENWQKVLSDPQVPKAILNTFIYIAIVLLGVPIAVWLATLMNRPGLRFANAYRAAFFMPYLALPVAVALVWKLMFNGQFGIINAALAVVGIDGPYWLATPGLALIAVSVIGLWMSIGFNIIILSAGLRGIAPELYEAASLDGAGRSAQLRHITIPQLAPTIFFVVIIDVIGGFQLFDLLFALLGAQNPALIDTQSLVYLFYQQSFIVGDRGYGAAIAIIILVLVAAVTAMQFRLQKRLVGDE